ncbi:hypothetical protein RI367_002678 [Sorochytrium milnesiophthora]
MKATVRKPLDDLDLFPQQEGYLYKRSTPSAKWQKRHFRLALLERPPLPSVLWLSYHYSAKRDSTERWSTAVHNIHRFHRLAGAKRPTMVLQTHERYLELSCSSQDELDEWYKNIETARNMMRSQGHLPTSPSGFRSPGERLHSRDSTASPGIIDSEMAAAGTPRSGVTVTSTNSMSAGEENGNGGRDYFALAPSTSSTAISPRWKKGSVPSMMSDTALDRHQRPWTMQSMDEGMAGAAGHGKASRPRLSLAPLDDEDGDDNGAGQHPEPAQTPGSVSTVSPSPSSATSPFSDKGKGKSVDASPTTPGNKASDRGPAAKKKWSVLRTSSNVSSVLSFFSGKSTSPSTSPGGDDAHSSKSPASASSKGKRESSKHLASPQSELSHETEEPTHSRGASGSPGRGQSLRVDTSATSSSTRTTRSADDVLKPTDLPPQVKRRKTPPASAHPRLGLSASSSSLLERPRSQIDNPHQRSASVDILSDRMATGASPPSARPAPATTAWSTNAGSPTAGPVSESGRYKVVPGGNTAVPGVQYARLNDLPKDPNAPQTEETPRSPAKNGPDARRSSRGQRFSVYRDSLHLSYDFWEVVDSLEAGETK